MYPSIAAYAIIQKGYPQKYNSLEGQVNGFTDIPSPEDENVDFHLASIHAFITIGKQLIFSEDKFTEFQEETYNKLLDEGLPQDVLASSKAYGDVVAEHIMKWADSDLYNQTRTYPKYTIIEEPEFWKPTPPDYMD